MSTLALSFEEFRSFPKEFPLDLDRESWKRESAKRAVNSVEETCILERFSKVLMLIHDIDPRRSFESHSDALGYRTCYQVRTHAVEPQR
jgi:hypothetical protein